MEIADASKITDWLKPRLEKVIRKCSPGWSAEQAIDNCLSGRWLLFTEEGEDGFLMVSGQACEYTGSQSLFVEAVYHSDESRNIQFYIPFLELLAKKFGADSAEFISSRRGWERAGFKPVYTLYRMEVQ